MALVTWSHTFRDGVAPMKAASVYIYLSGTTESAQVWDVNGTLHNEAPQLYTDITGYVEFQVADDYYSLSQAFDISCVPDPMFNEGAETVSLPGTLILQLAGKLSGSGLTIDLNSGTISSASGSTITIAGGGLDHTSGTSAWSGGTVNITGATINISASGTLNISAGTHTWSGGSINITGTTITISATAALNISAGTHTWSGGAFNLTAALINIYGSSAFNILASTHTWSGGTISVTGSTISIAGGSISVTSGSISISASGSFSMTAGTFSISGGTVSISAAGGLTIASGSKITINSTSGILLSSVGLIYYSATDVYVVAQSTITMNVGSTDDKLYLFGTPIEMSGHAQPASTLSYDFGTSSLAWDDGYFDTLYTHTPGAGAAHVTAFDHLDDLEIVSRYGSPDMIEPFHVLPVECTNIVKLAYENGITIDEVYVRKDLVTQIFYDPLMVGIFGIGAIKQLYNRVQKLERRMS